MALIRVALGLLMLALFGALNWYLFKRLVADVTTSPWVRRALAAVLLATYAAVPLLRLWSEDGTPPPTATFTVLTLWGLLLHVLLVLVAFEAVRWFLARRGRRQAPASLGSGVPSIEAVLPLALPTPPRAPDEPSRRQFLSRVGAATALGVGGGLTTFGVYRAMTPPALTEVPVRLPGLPAALEGFTIVQLSDVHVGAIIQTKFLDVLVAEANRAKPDLVAITGDLVDGPPAQLGQYVARLRNLSSRHGTYFCSGNHDYYSGWERWAKALEGMDFTVLRNRHVRVGDAAASLDLIGVEDWGTRFGGGEYDLDAAVAGRHRDRASVLLSHQPNNLDAVASHGIGLQLSGHTHGGQVFPGTLIGTAIWGERNTGLSRHGATWLYTSRGCGFVGPPMRVGAPPELVKLVLTRA
ncbi:MAG: metallophosphoesterase [Myxococcaceae bacterium]|nr:metallophosphoesterase [Myxococcaceae bacterium]